MANSVISSRSKGPDRVTTASPWIYVATALLAAAIFVADTATPIEYSVSVLYVVVILMAGRFLQRRGTASVATICVVLALISAVSTPPRGEAFLGVANTLISIAAITITSFLVLQSQAREMVLKEHVEERKRVEEKVRQQERELRAVLDFTPLLVAVFGPDRERLYANQPSLDYIGLTLEQWQGITDPLWFFHPDDRDRVAKGVYTGSGSDVPHEFEARFLRADGEYRWFLFRDNPLRDEQGRVMRWYLSAMDIEDRKRAEDELRESETRFRTFVDHAADAFFVHDGQQNGKVLDVNRQACESLGYTREELIGMVPQDFDPDVDEALLKMIHERIDAGETVTFETRHRQKEGTVFPVEVRVRPLWHGGRCLRLALARDIRDRKRAEEELRSTAAELQRVMAAVPDCLWSAEIDELGNWKYSYYSPAVEKITGQPSSHFMQDPGAWLGIVHADDKVGVTAAAQRLASGEVDLAEGEYRIIHANGEIRWIRDSAIAARLGPRLKVDGVISDITERKRAEVQLFEMQEQFRVLAESSLTGIYLIVDGRFRYVNPALARMFGYTVEEIVDGLGPSDLVYPDDRPMVAENIRRRIEGELDGLRYEFRGLRKDGTVFPVEVHGGRIERGGKIAVLGTLLDGTERKRAEEDLRASEVRYRTLVDYAADMILLRDDNGTLIDVNQYACESLRYTREELIGMTPRDLVDPNEDPVFFRSVDERLKKGELFAFESGFRRKDGTVFPVEVRVRPFSQGGQRFFLAIARDITERKQAEDALRASEARFRTFADHATDAFFVHDEHGTILDANREACARLGYTREELIGMHPFDLDRGQVTPPTLLTRARLEAGETVTFESVVRRKDGSQYPVEWRIRPYQQGNDRFALSSARDITERKHAEGERERLRELEAELAHINRVNVIGEMTASIAHEINQPLSGVVSNGEACLLWLDGDSPNLEEAREAARRIVRDGTRAGEIISRIRGLVKKSPPPKSALDLNETLREVIVLMSDEAKRRNVTIQTDLAEVLDPVLGDRVQLQQVVLNLVMNAMDAMHDSVSKRIRITTSNIDPGQVCVAVQDSGVGLDPNNLTRIFEPFYSTKSSMGMGLSISRSIVQSHGGRLWATTNEDAGVTVQFTLPRWQDGASIARN